MSSRIREKAHVEGNWACLISLSVSMSESEFLEPLRDALSQHQQQNKIQMSSDPFHISLSKTFYAQIQHHSFIRNFMEKKLLFEPFPIFEGIISKGPNANMFAGNFVFTTGEWEIFSNIGETCFFLALMIDGEVGGDDAVLQKLVHRIDRDLLSKFGWPLFFKDPKFHISVFWSTDEHALESFKTDNSALLQQIAENNMAIPIQDISCRVGDRIFNTICNN